MWLKLIQIVVFFAVIASNIQYNWTPNGYLVACLGFIAALLTTVFLLWLVDRFTALRLKLQAAEPEPGERWIGGWERLRPREPERRAHRNHPVKLGYRPRR
jgi:hypothetical protein